MSFSKSPTMELLKDFPTVLAYFVAFYLFLKKRDQKFTLGKKYHFQQSHFNLHTVKTFLTKYQMSYSSLSDVADI